MSSPQTQAGTVGSSSPHLILGTAAEAHVANSQTSAAALQRIQNDIYGLQAQLHGKHMEVAMAQGERDVARLHMQMMNSTLIAHRAFRMASAEAAGHCFFDASGSEDREAMRGGANA